MTSFIFHRIVSLVVTILAASLIVFSVMEILPADPAAIMLGVNAQPDTLAALREQMGLDQPALIRYFHWISGVFIGDFGTSYTYDVPVLELIVERMTVSLPLGVMAIVLSTALAIPLGLYSASKRGKARDAAIMGLAQLGVAVPNFWLGLVFILLFAVKWNLLPAGGFAGWDAGFWPGLRSLALPAIALAVHHAAVLARVTRSSVLETLNEDYIRTAHAKGAGRRAVLWRHALPNAMIPVVTIMGLQFASLLSGTIIIENVFTLPGLGRLIFQAIDQRDLIVVESVTILLVIGVIVMNFIVDLAYGFLDPRLRRRRS
ncbi:MAG: ABC transporter permease [Hyphomicrobiales bacterium]